jgi:hypothetical protein
MSPEQYLAGRQVLAKVGRFEGPVFIRTDEAGCSTKKFGINAIWHEAIGERMLIPAPRYSRPILMNPRAYRWTAVAQQRGVQRKQLGSFSERAVAADVFRLEAGASLRFFPEHAIRLLFVLQGEGRLGEQPLGRRWPCPASRGRRTSPRGRSSWW